MELSQETIHKIIERFEWDWCNEYGERGYGDHRTTMVVLGDFWLRPNAPKYDPKRGLWRAGLDHRYDTGQHDWGMASIDRRFPRIFQQLEEQGVAFEWCDEWIIDYEYSKCYRTTGDSYGWTPSYRMSEYGDMLTPDSDFDDWLDWARNDLDNALCDSMVGDNVDRMLDERGYTRRPPDGDRFEFGWHPGQNDTPRGVLDDITRDTGGRPGVDFEYVFVIDAVGQFDMHFAIWWKWDEDLRMYCDSCGRIGNSEDLCVPNEECPDLECDGIMHICKEAHDATV